MSEIGKFIEWYSYANNTPQPVAPAVPANPDQMIVQPGWGISHCLKFRGYPPEDYSNPAKWTWVANLNGVGRYEDFRLKPNQVITLPSYQAPAPAPAPQPAPQSDVIDITVGAGWGITHVLKAAGYTKEQWDNEAEWDRVAQLNGSPTRLRLQPGQRVKVYRNPIPALQPAPPVTDQSNTLPNEDVPDTNAAAVNPDATESTAVLAPVKKDAWKDSFIPTSKPTTYIAQYSTIVNDIEGLHIPLQLSKNRMGKPTKVTVGGTFEKDGTSYYRSARHVEQGKWYGIPLDAIKLEKEDDEFADFDMDLKHEANEAVRNINLRKWLLGVIATIEGWFSRKKK